ncbi:MULTISPECIES: asparaginase [Sphingobacterium]|jgi:L-asparaginase|uniref:asparaginase n=2 Tax=Sphingobacterium multivorum TaxID=28454 RepID=A0A2X2JHX3_SPHMU|nr:MULTISPECIES: type I asparaginase [Sphingobacterium]HAE69749.1 type I asparaginase [Sphingobacterium sp.]KKO92169.1 1-alkyl-2-acetylglycerophosphocholine esterase [Sphingobacterium sp. Ag1]MDF2852053.1 L-asparaginase 1 [Sphingobacterium multivorum]OJZ08625.1 MAG: L-asparaginase 1 [Sphingobacterium sp. 40-24]QQT64278.1 type I asparaginase [Sphingobacterium multivorum]
MHNIFIIYTGGTIGMVKDETGTFVPFDFELIKRNLPDLSRLDYKLTVHSFEPIIDSSNMKPEIWIEMAQIIKDNYANYDGFVILHGSDTMAFTASVLSFMLEGLQKPVILSGSQLPIGEIRTDARENMMTALEIASAKQDGISIIQEVCILFDNKLFRGNRSFKYNSAKFEAFRSPNYPVLVEAGIHLKYNTDALLNNIDKEFILHTKLDNRVAVLKLFPGISAQTIKAVLDSDVRSIVMETFGSGNTTTDTWFLDLLKEAIEQGKNILNISQCKVGSVELGRYETSQGLKSIGVLNGYDLTFEAAVTKLMYLQGELEDQKEVAYWIEKDIRGELTIND